MKYILSLLLAAALCSQAAGPALAAEAEGDTIYISDAAGWLALAENCALDAWSAGKTVVLTADISLHSVDVRPVPSFGGTLEGGGHSITGLDLRGAGAPAGLFGTVEESGVIRNLRVFGSVRPSGLGECVGGIAGKNSGYISNCSFSGTVDGTDSVGGIAGRNGLEGRLNSCSSGGTISGKSRTGGVAGENLGVISGCGNSAYVNISGADPGINASELNLDFRQGAPTLQTLDTVNIITDTGGVAGYSTGMIISSTNRAAVGYPHVGYNVGGIVGRSSGYVYNCRNEGAVYGRRDIGGIAGQAEPYVELRLTADRAERLRGELDELRRLIDSAAAAAKDSSDDISAILSAANRLAGGAADSGRALASQVLDYAGVAVAELDRGGDVLADTLDRLSDISGELTDMSEDVAAAAGLLAQGVRELGETGEFTEDALQELEAAAGWAGEAGDTFTEGARQITGGLGQLDRAVSASDAAAARQGIQELRQGIRLAGAALESAAKAVDTLKNVLAPGEEPISGALSELPDRITDAIIPGARSAARDLAAALRSAVQAMGALEQGAGMLENAVPDLSQMRAGLREALRGLERMTDAPDALGSAVSGLAAALRDAEAASGRLGSGLGTLADAAELFGNVSERGTGTLEKTEDILAYLTGVDPFQISPPPDEIRDSVDAVHASLSSLNDELSALNSRSNAVVGDLTGDVRAINAQFGNVADALLELFYDLENPGVEDRIRDTSAEDVDHVTTGKLRECVNRGSVAGDINVGGVAGSMGIEYEYDPENDLPGDGASLYRREYTMKAILQRCENGGAVTAKRDYAGSICGQVELGLVTECTALGSAESESGDYVGGVAGWSAGTIRDSLVKCALSGRRYVGGVTGAQAAESFGGSGGLTANCSAFVRVDRAEQYAGAVSGTDAGEFVGNRFVSGELAGLDGVSAEGKAEPVDYAALLESGTLPEAFRRLTLRFRADGAVIRELRFDYGDSFGPEAFPGIPAKEGMYAVWDRTELENLTFDTDVNAVYAPWLEALASESLREDGRPVFLLEGAFSDTDRFDAEITEHGAEELDRRTPLYRRTLVERWSFAAPDGAGAEHALRYLSPSGDSGGLELWGRTPDGIWRKLDAEGFGSYLRFIAPAGVTLLAVTDYHPLWWVWAVAGVLAAAAIVLPAALLRQRKRRKAAAKRRAEPEAGTAAAGEAAAPPPPAKQTKRRRWLWIAVALLCMGAAATAWFALGLNRDAAALRLLRRCAAEDSLSMELTLQGGVDGRSYYLDTELYRMTADGKRIEATRRSGLTVWYCDGLVYLENGRTYEAGSFSPGYTALLDDFVALYQGTTITEFEGRGERIYTVTVTGDAARRILENLLPRTSARLSEVGNVRLELVERSGALYALRAAGDGVLADAAGEERALRLNASLLLRTEKQAPELPSAVRAAIAAGGGDAETPDEATLRLLTGWLRLAASEPLDAQVLLSADCGPLMLSDQLEWTCSHEDGAVVHRIRKNGRTLIYASGSVRDENGNAAEDAGDVLSAQKLLELASRLCMAGTPEISEEDGAAVYSIALDEDAMEELFETLLPDGTSLDVLLREGTAEVAMRDLQIERVRFVCSGNVALLGVSAPVSLAAALDITEAGSR